MNHYLQNHYSNLPGHIHHNPIINFSTRENNHEEKLKNKSVRKDVPLTNDKLYIILADDDADDRELFGEIITETGFNIKLDYAEDGRELLNMLQTPSRELPNMIFLDLNMPNKSGIQCLEVIRNSERLKHIPVIIYSTSASMNDIDETYEKGANLYVRKPSSYHDLLGMARTVLKLDWDNYQSKGLKTNFVFSSKTK
jgi:CheY-like chemotaxis protein